MDDENTGDPHGQTVTSASDLHIGYVHLRVINLDRMMAFYSTTLGFHLRKQEGDTTYLSATGSEPDHLILTEKKDAQPLSRTTTGLYHQAIRLPSRSALANVLLRLSEQKIRLHGASDHGVSEAIYLTDPEGNGLELYSDRPVESWPVFGERVEMVNEPLDIEELVAQVDRSKAWDGIDPGTNIGHVHLQVADLRTTEEFYHNEIGLHVTARMPGAVFLAAGNYHHHVGANIWAGANLPPPDGDSAGLISFSVVASEPQAWKVATKGSFIASNQRVHDPNGIGVDLVIDTTHS